MASSHLDVVHEEDSESAETSSPYRRSSEWNALVRGGVTSVSINSSHSHYHSNSNSSNSSMNESTNVHIRVVDDQQKMDGGGGGGGGRDDDDDDEAAGEDPALRAGARRITNPPLDDPSIKKHPPLHVYEEGLARRMK